MWTAQNMRKIFVGGIDYTTTDESLKSYFQKYGEVIDAVVMREPTTNRSRGFGFVTYISPEHVDGVQNDRPHKVDGRLVETKRAVPRCDNHANLISVHNESRHCRIFIGALPQDVTEEDLKEYFTHYGNVVCVNVMYDKVSGRHRGFAFVDFNDYDPVDKVLLTHSHSIKGRPVDVKRAISKAEVSQLKILLARTGMLGPEAVLGAVGPNIPTETSGEISNSTEETSLGTEENGATSAVGRRPNPNISMKPFLPRIPLAALSGFSAQLQSGWQYSISNNAEVLRNTAGAVSNQPSGAPSLLKLMNNGSGIIEERESSENSTEEENGDVEVGQHNVSSSKCPDDVCPENAKILIIEPFYGGSHRQLIRTLRKDESLFTSDDVALLTLPSKKWHWKARTSALYFYQKIPQKHQFKVLFSSSTLNLCELISLRPDLSSLKKVLYFHENQLTYPVQQRKDRDFQYGYNQILSCIVANSIVFNSQYNLESFIREIPRHLKLQPGLRPDATSIVSLIKEKSKVLYFPISLEKYVLQAKNEAESLHIIWPHRWEHDKDPGTFFHVLFQLVESGLEFHLSVLGESFSEYPPIFSEAKLRLANHIRQWGYVKDKDTYWEILHTGDVVVSTAHHEFFGVAMLEAVGAGCFPFCPNRLAYPEIYPQECLYNTTQQLQEQLAEWCSRPQLVRAKQPNVDINSFTWSHLKSSYMELFQQ